jgi:hypothetical protein
VLIVWDTGTGTTSPGNVAGRVGLASAAKEFAVGLRMVNRGIRIDNRGPRGKAGNSIS